MGVGVLAGGVTSGVFVSGRLTEGVLDAGFCVVVLVLATTGVFFTIGLDAGGDAVFGAVGASSTAGAVSASS